MKPIVVLLVAAMLIGPGCSGASIGSWFKPEEVTTLAPKEGYKPVATDNRPLIEEITALRVENTLGGVILIAEGLPPTQGYWSADLVPADAEDTSSTTRRFEFRAWPPLSDSPSGTAASRKIETGIFMTNQELEGVRTLTVVAVRNSRSVNR